MEDLPGEEHGDLRTIRRPFHVSRPKGGPFGRQVKIDCAKKVNLSLRDRQDGQLADSIEGQKKATVGTVPNKLLRERNWVMGIPSSGCRGRQEPCGLDICPSIVPEL